MQLDCLHPFRRSCGACFTGLVSASARLCIFAVTLLGAGAANELRAADPRTRNAPIAFDIAAQPLNAALGLYGDATGREGLYDAGLANGRISGEVRGSFPPDVALTKLLSGTGLVAEFVDDSTFVLLPRSGSTATASQQPRPPDDWRYYGLIQASLIDALCRQHLARPGDYRLVAMVWIAPDGALQRAVRLGSTGMAEADHQIDAALGSLRLGEPPPKGFASPVLILVVPRQTSASVCDRVDATARSERGR